MDKLCAAKCRRYDPALERRWPMRLDLHVHTSYSYDSGLGLDALVRSVHKHGLDGVAVLDHDEIEGGLRLREVAPFTVIVGEEIGTRDGGIAGLFLHERIPPHLSAEETIARIHAQDGLVLVPHPLARGVPGRIDPHVLMRIIGQVDIIEGYNARSPLPADDAHARALAEKHGIVISAGSDAHFAFEVGRSYTEIAPFDGPETFLRSLSAAHLVMRKTPYVVPGLTVSMIPVRALWRRWQAR